MRVVARGEEQLAAAEPRLVAVRAVGVLLHQAIERLQRRLELAVLLVGTRQLVQHAVVARVLRIGLQVFLVARDGGLVVGAVRRGVGHALVVGAVHLEVAQAPHRLRALRRFRRDLEELAIGGDRLLLAGLDAGILVQLDLAAGERPEGGLVVVRACRALALAPGHADQDEEREAMASAHRRHSWRRWRGRTAAPPRNAPASHRSPGAPSGA